MQIVFGVILAAGGGWATWWLFTETSREGLHGMVWLVALLVCLIGILLIFLRIKAWWMSE